ncbi:hypothetical protein ACFL3Z_01465 [Gemmatimonadota bacterium]
MRTRTKLPVAGLLLSLFGLALTSCGGGGPEPGFDVTGLWTEVGGDSTIRFTAGGGYEINFEPGLEGTTSFSGDSYERVDNATVTFNYLSGRGAAMEMILVEMKINSRHQLSFKLGDRRFRFTRAE